MRRLWHMLLPSDLRFSLHGYFRAPLRLSIDRRSMTMPGQSGYNIRTPWLVDDDYFNSGFAYTRLQEQDWTELYLSVGNRYLVGTVALMGSLYSDWAQPLIDHQWGIAQGFLRFHWDANGARARFRVDAKAGAFWDRLGWLQRYDTYLFGRTHQMGGQVRIETGVRDWSFWIMQGMGAHLEALDQNEGLTILNYLHAGARWRQNAEIGFYFLDSLVAGQAAAQGDQRRRHARLRPRHAADLAQARLAALHRRLEDRGRRRRPTSRPPSRSCTRTAAAG